MQPHFFLTHQNPKIVKKKSKHLAVPLPSQLASGPLVKDRRGNIDMKTLVARVQLIECVGELFHFVWWSLDPV